MSERLFKVTGPDGAAFHGGTLDWPVPNGKPGKWVKVSGDLVPCANGLHLCRAKDLLNWLGPVVWEAEAGRERAYEEDKVVVRRARLVKRLNWDDRVARLFAADCAERVLPIFEREHPGDDRPRKAVAAARSYANGEIGAAAWDAARAAAWDAAGDAAWDAAGDAAWAAAWDAAWAAARGAAWAAARAAAWDAARGAARGAAWDAAWGAAWDAAGDAARDWQIARLVAYLDGEAA